MSEACTYCKRTMDPTGDGPLRKTRDHVMPRSKNKGNPNKLVWACRHCNELKSDMLPGDWQSFMECYPRWWENPLFSKFGRPAKQIASGNRIPKPPAVEVTRRFLREASAKALIRPDVVPVEYDDPKVQMAFEAVYENRLGLLRVEKFEGGPAGTAQPLARSAETRERASSTLAYHGRSAETTP